MFLREIAERHYKYRGTDFGQCSIHSECFDKDFEEEIIKQNRTHYHHHVFGQLFPFPHCRSFKYHITAQEKTNWKCNNKRHEKCGNMRAHR